MHAQWELLLSNKLTTVKSHDSTIYVDDAWTAQDNFDLAIDRDGNKVDFSEVTVDASQVDPSNPGKYNVTYTYDGVTSTSKVTVLDKQKADTNPNQPSQKLPSPTQPSENNKSSKKESEVKHSEVPRNSLNQKQLPQTGEKDSIIPIMIGIIILLLFSSILIFERKKV